MGIIGSSVILACSATFLFAGFFRPEIPAPSTPFFRVELLFCNDGSAGDEDFVKNVNDQSQSADEGAHQNIGSQAPSEPVEQIA